MKMFANFFTLRALGHEFHHALEHAAVLSIYSQTKNELLCRFVTEGDDEQTLCISVDPERTCCYVTSSMRRARKNSVTLFPDLQGAVVNHITVPSIDRVIEIGFHNDMKMTVRMYGTAENNILVLDNQENVIDAFKRKKEVVGTTIRRESQSVDEIIDAAKTIIMAKINGSAETIKKGMRKAFPILGTSYIAELLHRAGIQEDRQCITMNDADFDNLYGHLVRMMNEFEQPHPVIYECAGEKHLFSLVPLSYVNECRAMPFPSVNDAVRRHVRTIFQEHDNLSKKEIWFDKLSRTLRRAEHTGESIRKEISSSGRSEEYERIGSAILANVYLLTKGMTEAALEDPRAQGNNLRVKLDPLLTPPKNAERYFEKAKHAKAALHESKKRLEKNNALIATLNEMLKHLESVESAEGMKKFKQQFQKQLTEMNIHEEDPGREPIPFRTFSVAGEYEVWVGKSSAQNDLLTMKYAKPNDLWFHARGASGSHTVLRRKGKDAPPKEAIRQAASIAAYYSKMRNASSVPVAYCEKKYVRKPKGAPPGTVTLEREEVVFVTPRLP